MPDSPKICSCGKIHVSESDFAEYLGYSEGLEWFNCSCGSTLVLVRYECIEELVDM